MPSVPVPFFCGFGFSSVPPKIRDRHRRLNMFVDFRLYLVGASPRFSTPERKRNIKTRKRVGSCIVRAHLLARRACILSWGLQISSAINAASNGNPRPLRLLRIRHHGSRTNPRPKLGIENNRRRKSEFEKRFEAVEEAQAAKASCWQRG